LFNKKEIESLQSDIAHFKRLVEAQKAYIKTLEGNGQKTEYVIVSPPKEEELLSYYTTLSMLTSDRWFLAFFDALKRKVMTDIEAGDKSIDFYRGKLSTLSDIFGMSRVSRDYCAAAGAKDEV
jgi:hypothetical protein